MDVSRLTVKNVSDDSYNPVLKPAAVLFKSKMIRKLTPDEMKTVVVAMPDWITDEIHKALNRLNFKYCGNRVEKHENPEFLPHMAVSCCLKASGNKKEIWLPKHQYIAFKHEVEFHSFLLCENIKLDENIIGDSLYDDIPVALASISEKPIKSDEVFLCEYVPMRMCCLTRPNEKSNPRYLTTTNLQSCYAITLWDSESKTSSMTHFFNYEISDNAISTLKEKMIQNGVTSENIEAFVIGGLSLNMGDPCDYFNFIEDSLKRHSIRVVLNRLLVIIQTDPRILFLIV